MSELSSYVKKLAFCNAESDTLAISLAAFRDGYISKEQLDDLTSICPQGNPQVPTVAERRTALLNHIHTNLQEKLDKYAKDTEPDVLALARKALSERLIKQDVINHLTSLHPQVPISMRYRYLLTQMRVTLLEILTKSWKRTLKIQPYKLDSGLYHLEFVKNAFKDKQINEAIFKYLTTDLYPELPGGLKPRDLEEIQRRFILQIEYERGFQKPTRPKKKFFLHLDYSEVDELSLSLNNLPELNEKLVDYAYKWEKIGIALKFQPQNLSNIQAMPLLLIDDAPKSYLTKLLKEWLLRTHEYTLPPTVDNLKAALRSKSVGLGALADKLQLSNIATTDCPVYSWVKLSLATTEPGFPKYDDIYLNEGESTLLEVQITSTDSPSTCKWFKDGIEFTQNKTEPILCLHNADIDWSGNQFSCEVSGQFKTAPITVHIKCPLDKYAGSLAAMYSAQPKLPEDTWPPVSSKNDYINLALIKQQIKYNCSSEYTRQTIRRDMDDILQHKEKIEYEHVYNDLKSRQLVIIEGRPGCGKTTFVHKMAQDWAGRTKPGPIRLVLLVSLRVLNTISKLNLSDILKLFPDLTVSQELIEQRSGKGVCFIFDGLDEFSPPDGKSSLVYQIIKKQYLSKSTVIVASRPAAIAELRGKVHRSRVIEVLGFLGDQIEEYFDQYPFASSQKISELKAYLRSHPNILHICYLPIHAAMVGFLFDITGSVPRTETKIYELFTRYTLMRNLSKNGEFEPSDVDLHSLNEEQQQLFRQICQLAFEKTLSKKQVLTQDEVCSFFEVKKHGDISLGLITVDRTAGLYGFKNIYTFQHLTFQEYLAAYHISTLSKEQLMKLIEEHGDKNHMLVVWKFYCGLIKDKRDKVVEDKKVFTLIFSKITDFFYSMQCTFEYQQTTACTELLETIKYHIKLSNKHYLVPDYTAIGYIIKNNTSANPVVLSLVGVDMEEIAINALLSEMKNTKLLLCLHIERATIDATQKACIVKLLANISILKLSIKVDEQTEFEKPVIGSNFTSITSLLIPNVKKLICICDLPFRNLEALNLGNCITEHSEIEALANGLKSAEKLVDLDVSNNNIATEGANLLIEGLKGCRKLERINIAKNLIQSAELIEILTSIGECYLKVTAEEIIDQKVPSLSSAKLMEYFTNLQSLNATVSRYGVESFYNNSKKWTSLKELHLQLEYDMKTSKLISSSLKWFTKLTVLSLKGNSYTVEDMKCLMKNLRNCPNFQILDLSANKIGDKLARIVTSNLHCYTHLQELDLSYNNISTTMANKIKSNFPHLKLKLDNMLSDRIQYHPEDPQKEITDLTSPLMSSIPIMVILSIIYYLYGTICAISGFIAGTFISLSYYTFTILSYSLAGLVVAILFSIFIIVLLPDEYITSMQKFLSKGLASMQKFLSKGPASTQEFLSNGPVSTQESLSNGPASTQEFLSNGPGSTQEFLSNK